MMARIDLLQKKVKIIFGLFQRVHAMRVSFIYKCVNRKSKNSFRKAKLVFVVCSIAILFVGVQLAPSGLVQANSTSAEQTGESGELTITPEIERILSLEADPEYGEYLASECLTCHVGTSSGSVPLIHGTPKASIVDALLAYKSGARTNSVMKLMSENLGDDEIAALAAFFSTAQ